MLIGIVDYGMGNLLSVYNAFSFLGSNVKICRNPEDLDDTDRLVVPGVGAFKDCISKLKSLGFIDALNEYVLHKAKPTMGICLGMQIMACRSFEGGESQGLGWFDADVVRLHPDDSALRIPNIGWNEITYQEELPLFKGIPQRADLYLVHSFYMNCKNPIDIVATYDYGNIVTAAVLKNNIFATQFHPEKSQDFGLRILENFINWKP